MYQIEQQFQNGVTSTSELLTKESLLAVVKDHWKPFIDKPDFKEIRLTTGNAESTFTYIIRKV